MPTNNVTGFINQQYGFSTWRDSDMAIKRLRCKKDNLHTFLLPPTDDVFFRDTPIFACKFSPQEGNEHLVALANEEGKLAVHDSVSNTRYGIEAHNNAIFDLAWMFDQMKLVTASGDHMSKLYSIDNGDIRVERVFCGHSRSVKTVAFRKDDSSVFASGGRDGNIILWDTRSDLINYMVKADRTISNSHIAKNFTPSKTKKRFGTPTSFGIKSVTGLVFQDTNTLVSCGAGDGVIKVWDLRRNYTTYKKEAIPKNCISYPGNTTKNGYSNLVIDDSGIKLYANCLDNSIYCYNMATYNPEPIMKYVGHQNHTFYVKSSLCKDGNYLVSGSSDDYAYIWNTKNSQPLVRLTGHTAEVTCVAWCHKNNSLITCSDDMTHKIWTVGPEEYPEDWNIYCRGQAEILPVEKGLKRTIAMDDAVELTPKKFFVECEKCNNATSSARFCENCSINSSKRKNTSEFVSENKRILTEFGPRRLFTNVTYNIPEESEMLAKVLDGKDTVLDDSEPPSKKSRLNSPSTSISSPTVNLPNFVVDGTAPHLNYSPPKKKCQDWLTRIRIEKSLRKEMQEKTVGPSTPKTPKLDTPRRPSSPRSPLLRYFKVTNSTQKCDGLTCSKSHPNFVTSNMQSSQ